MQHFRELGSDPAVRCLSDLVPLKVLPRRQKRSKANKEANYMWQAREPSEENAFLAQKGVSNAGKAAYQFLDGTEAAAEQASVHSAAINDGVVEA